MTRPPPPDIVARLRELIVADTARGGAGHTAGVWRVRATEALFVYGIDEHGDVVVIDLDRAVPKPERETDFFELVATYREAARLQPELAPLVSRASRRYFTLENGMFYEQWGLVLGGDGTCELGVAFSDPAGAAGGWDASGHWTHVGKRIHMVFDQRDSDSAPRDAQVTLVDAKHAEVHGIATFQLDERS
jgi:hypothetical protein